MTSEEIARDYLEQAKSRRVALEALFGAGGYPSVVRESQEMIELILKGAARFVGVDPPRRHDVHKAMPDFVERLPAEWRSTLDELRETLDRLAADRGPAF
jgi:HEPN domain-containing protein